LFKWSRIWLLNIFRTVRYLQHPGQTSVQLRIHPLYILQRDRLVQQLFIKRQREPSFQLVIVKNGYPQNPPDEMKIGQMLRIDGRIRIDLQRVVVVPAVLEQPVLRVEHLPRQQMQPLPRHPSVIQPLFPFELDHQPLAHILRPHLHNEPVTLLEDLVPGHLQPTVTALGLQRRQFRPEGFQFRDEISPVLGQVFAVVQQPLGQLLPQSRSRRQRGGILGGRLSVRQRHSRGGRRRRRGGRRGAGGGRRRRRHRRRRCRRLVGGGGGRGCRARPAQDVVEYLSVEAGVGELGRPVIVVYEVDLRKRSDQIGDRRRGRGEYPSGSSLSHLPAGG
jgi:hypothetical protein